MKDNLYKYRKLFQLRIKETTNGSSQVVRSFKYPSRSTKRNRRGILFRQQHPWEPRMPRGCVTACKLFGYQLRAPRRLVLQVVNELRPSPSPPRRVHRGEVSKPLLIYIPVARRARLVASTRDRSRPRRLTIRRLRF